MSRIILIYLVIAVSKIGAEHNFAVINAEPYPYRAYTRAEPQVFTPPLLVMTQTFLPNGAATAQKVYNYFSNAYKEIRHRQDELLHEINKCSNCDLVHTDWQKLLTALSNIPSLHWVSNPDSDIRDPNEVTHKPNIPLPWTSTPQPLINPTEVSKPVTPKPIHSVSKKPPVSETHRPTNQMTGYPPYVHYPSPSYPYDVYSPLMQSYRYY